MSPPVQRCTTCNRMTGAEKIAAMLDELTTELDAADAYDPGRGGQHVGTGLRLASAPGRREVRCMICEQRT